MLLIDVKLKKSDKEGGMLRSVSGFKKIKIV